jgi:hypothetical protein
MSAQKQKENDDSLKTAVLQTKKLCMNKENMECPNNNIGTILSKKEVIR